MEHPLEQLQVSSLISRITRRAEQISAATVWIQIICSYLPPRVIFKMIGQTNSSIVLAARDFNALRTTSMIWTEYIFKRDQKRPFPHCLSSMPKQMMVQFARWEEVKKKIYILWCVFSTNSNWQRNKIIKVYFAMCCTAIFTFVYCMFSSLQTSRLSLYPSPSPILCNTTLTSVSDAA